MKTIEETLLSVITVVKNDLSGLERTRKSVLNQKDISIEHVIVDGGSSDGSEIFAYENSDVKIQSQPDGGIYGGMQRGLNAVNGTHVIYLNSGDVFVGDYFLSYAVQELLAKNSRWGFGPIIESTTRGTFAWNSCNGIIDSKAIQSRKTFIAFPCVIMSKEILEETGGFQLNLKIAGDFELLVKLTRISMPIRWNFPLVCFSAGGVSYSKAPLAWKEENLVRQVYLENSLLTSMNRYYYLGRKVSKWYLGKFLDFLTRHKVLCGPNWRDKRAASVPYDFLTYID